jgi:hypothetical protein
VTATRPQTSRAPGLRPGEIVEVRSRDEIMATLDERGELDSLPFMPEMLRFCGQRFTVAKRAMKLCDTITWSGMRRMEDAVHLTGVRCDGGGHGGCQAGCFVYWKEAWLKRVDARDRPPAPATGPATSAATVTPATLDAAARPAEDRFACQATELLRAAPGTIASWDLRQYVEDVTSGNARPWQAVRSVLVGAFNEYQDLSRRLLPTWLRIRGGERFPFIRGRLTRTPDERLGLQPGDVVRVRSREEILATLDTGNRNRGMSFDGEMLKYCGREARVLRRVERIIDEGTGRMLRFGNPCIVLEDVVCTGDFHRVCPRSIYPYWREIWLERIR